MKKASFLSAILSLALVINLLVPELALTAEAISVGTVYAPAADKWGSQGNNNWYWMVQDKATGDYEQLPYDAGIGQFSAASKYDGQRISQSDAMVPAGAKLVFAFRAPVGGNVEVNFNAVAAPESAGQQGRIRLEALKNGIDGITIDSYDASSIEMENDNTVRNYKMNVSVKKHTMVYVTFSCDYLHYLYLGNPFPTFSATYKSVNSDVEDKIEKGAVYSPISEEWGTQNNGGWNWMIQDKTTGVYSQMSFNQDMQQFSSAAQYADSRISQVDAMIPKDAKLVFAFKAPVGGKVSFRFNAVVAPESESQKGRVTMAVSKNGVDPIGLDGYNESSIEMENDNTLRTYTFSTDIKKNSMVYISFSCEFIHYLYLGGPDPTFSAFYNSVNDSQEDEYFGKSFSPDSEKWGTQGNNGWHWMTQSKDGNSFSALPYNTEVGVENQFSNFAAYGDLRISQSDAVVPAKANLAFAFKAPKGGKIDVAFNAVAAPESDTQKGRVKLSVVNSKGEAIKLNGYNASSIEMENDDQLRTYSFTADVKQNTVVYIIFSCDYSHYLYFGTPFPTFSATYQSVNDEVDVDVPMEDSYVGKTFFPQEKDWGKQGVNGFYYMYNIKGSAMMAELPFASEKQFPASYTVHSTHEHLHFNKDGTMHTASSAGTALAHKAPVGGKVLVTVRAKGGTPVGTENSNEDMFLTVLRDTKQVYPEKGSITLPRTDKDLGVYTFETEVAAGDMLYALASCDAARPGYLTMSVTYLSRNNKVNDSNNDPRLKHLYEIDYSGEAWGKQDNNSWTFEFLDLQSKKFKKLAWSSGKDKFVGVSEDGKYEHLMMARYGETHPSLYGNPALVFTSPYSGEINLVVQSRLGDPVSSNGTAVSVMLNGKAVKDAVRTSGNQTSLVVSISVKRGDKVAVALDSLGNVSFDTTVLRAYVQYTAVDSVQPDSPTPTTGQKPIVGVVILGCGAVLAVLIFRKKRKASRI